MKIQSASYEVTNSDVEGRAYTFNATVKAEASTGNIRVDSGTGYRGEGMEQVATFNNYGDNNTSLSFFVPAEEQPAVLEAVNAFIGEAKAKAAQIFAPAVAAEAE